MTTTTAPNSDERVKEASPLRKILGRPEMAAVGGAIAVWVLFAITAGDSGFLSLRGMATYLEVAAELGILAIAVSLLMIGGEFDLSVGSMIGGAGMVTAVLAGFYEWNIWPAIFVSLLFSLGVGWANGYLVMRTKLPSFIITLGTLFIIRGATIAVSRLVTNRTQIGGLDDVAGYELARIVFAYEIPIGEANFPISIVWWLALAAVATFILLRTSVGNWIFGMGGDNLAARNVGVPVDRLKIGLFMATAAAAWLVGTIQTVNFTGADVLRGNFREFHAIIAVVIGGTLLTGGYGSAIGAVLGALIFGMTQQGIVLTGVDSDWFRVVLGTLLVGAVLVNNYIRKRASEA